MKFWLKRAGVFGSLFFAAILLTAQSNPGLVRVGTVAANQCAVWANNSNGIKAATCSTLNAVTSVFGRTGAVVAVLGDYSFSLISGTLSYAQLGSDVFSTAWNWTGLKNKFGSGTYTPTPNGQTSDTNALAEILQSGTVTWPDPIFVSQKKTGTVSGSGPNINAAFYMTKSGSAATDTASNVYIETYDTAGGSSSFSEGTRINCLLASSATNGSCYGTISNALMGSGLASWKYAIGMEGGVTNNSGTNQSDTTNSATPTSLSSSFAAVNGGAKKITSAYSTSPFSTGFLYGFVSWAPVDNSHFQVNQSGAYGFDTNGQLMEAGTGTLSGADIRITKLGKLVARNNAGSSDLELLSQRRISSGDYACIGCGTGRLYGINPNNAAFAWKSSDGQSNAGARTVVTHGFVNGNFSYDGTYLSVDTTASFDNNFKTSIWAAKAAVSSGAAIKYLTVDGGGHWSNPGGSAPVPSSCGTSPAVTSGSTDVAGEFTEGSVATGCTLTFAQAFSNAPFCTVTSQGGLVFSYTVSTTAITITNVGALSSTKLNYTCIGA